MTIKTALEIEQENLIWTLRNKITELEIEVQSETKWAEQYHKDFQGAFEERNILHDRIIALEAELAELNARIAELEAENDRLMNDWMEDETIVGSGELRPVLSKTLKRLDDLEAENAALKAAQAWWYPASEPPIGEGVYLVYYGDNCFGAEKLSKLSPTFSNYVTHWRELPAPPEVKNE